VFGKSAEHYGYECEDTTKKVECCNTRPYVCKSDSRDIVNIVGKMLIEGGKDTFKLVEDAWVYHKRNYVYAVSRCQIQTMCYAYRTP
jgi:hypothetical protein